MAIPILFREEFKEWLVTSKICKPASADSYASYLSGVNGQFDIDGLSMCERIEKYHNEGDPFKINQLIIDLVGELYREDICEITGRPQKTINNWRSALLQYTEFFYFFTEDAEAVNWENKADDEVVDIVINKSAENDSVFDNHKNRTTTYKYPVKDLMKNFKFRIITQDRFYGEIFFPISYIKRLLNQNKEAEYFNKWMEDQLNDIDIFCQNETHKFQDISELTIKVSKELNEVYITVNKVQKLIYSPNSIGDKLIPFTSLNLKSIAIDHVNSMKNILIDNIQFLPQLMLITSHIKAIAGGKATAKNYKAAGSILITSTSTNGIDINSLKKEMELIKSQSKFQLMDKIENIKKGAK